VRPLNPLKTSREVRYNTRQFELPSVARSRRPTKIIRKCDLLLSLRLTVSDRNKNDNETLHEIGKNGTAETHSPMNQKRSLPSDNQMNAYRQDTNTSRYGKVQSIDLKNKSFQGSFLGSYFPFLQSSSPTTSKVSNLEVGSSNCSSALKMLNKKANDTITVADLEIILSQMQPPPYTDRIRYPKNEVSPARFTTTLPSKSTTNTKMAFGPSHVAFPQPSLLTGRELQRGTSVAGCFLGMVIGITILPNLWLVGGILGSFYGYEITKIVSTEDNNLKDSNIVGKFLISCGRQLARAYLQLVDYWKGLWFLYKTGQLSYEYYKTYENLDKKFAVQSKIDAWNRVFVEGKQKFDAWEQENEVGRTVLAGLRTAWLVDEQSRKRATGRSKYRLVQTAYDVKKTISRFLQNSFSSIKSAFREQEIKTFLKGLRIDMSREGSVATRLGAIGAALVAINVFGAIFSISPAFSNFLAIVFAAIWPSWAPDLASRTQEIGMEIKLRGYKENNSLSGSSVKVFDPVKFVRRRCEENKNGKITKSTSAYTKYRKPSFGSKTERAKYASSPFRLSFDSKKKHLGASGKVRTWRDFKIR